MRKRLYTAAAVLLAGLLVVATYLWSTRMQRELRFKVTDVTIDDSDLDICYGSDTARLTIYMFATYNCRHCRAFLNQDLPEIKERYINDGKVRLVIKPIDWTENYDMMSALMLAGCMNRDGNADDVLELLQTEPETVYSDEFRQLIDDIINGNPELAECLVSDDFAYVKKNNALFGALGSKVTPIFVIGNHLYKGHRKIEQFCQVIEYELNK